MFVKNFYLFFFRKILVLYMDRVHRIITSKRSLNLKEEELESICDIKECNNNNNNNNTLSKMHPKHLVCKPS